MPRKQRSVKCRATTKAGQPCGRWAVIGALVCPHHGGNAPQVQAKAAERRDSIQIDALEQMRELIPAAVQAMQEILNNTEARPADRIAAANGILDRFVAKKIHAEVDDNREELDLDEQIAKIDQDQQETG